MDFADGVSDLNDYGSAESLRIYEEAAMNYYITGGNFHAMMGKSYAISQHYGLAAAEYAKASEAYKAAKELTITNGFPSFSIFPFRPFLIYEAVLRRRKKWEYAASFRQRKKVLIYFWLLDLRLLCLFVFFFDHSLLVELCGGIGNIIQRESYVEKREECKQRRRAVMYF